MSCGTGLVESALGRRHRAGPRRGAAGSGLGRFLERIEVGGFRGRVEDDQVALLDAVGDLDQGGRIQAQFDRAPFQAFVGDNVADFLALDGPDRLERDGKDVSPRGQENVDSRRHAGGEARRGPIDLHTTEEVAEVFSIAAGAGGKLTDRHDLAVELESGSASNRTLARIPG